MTCSYCHTPITNLDYIDFQDKFWHYECYQTECAEFYAALEQQEEQKRLERAKAQREYSDLDGCDKDRDAALSEKYNDNELY
jgi:hypothetical protein